MQLTEADKEEFKDVLREVSESHLKEFYISRTEHYVHHRFLKKCLETLQLISHTLTRGFTMLVLGGVVTLLLLGLWAYLKTKINAVIPN